MSTTDTTELDRLDRLCAEKIMGWAIHLDEYGNKSYYADGKLHWVCIEDYQPTRDIIWAWELLEKLDLRSIRITRTATWNVSLLEQFDEDGNDAFRTFRSRANSGSLAIVKACLRAKEVDI